MHIDQEVEICGKDVHGVATFWNRHGIITEIGEQSQKIKVAIPTTDGLYTTTIPFT